MHLDLEQSDRYKEQNSINAKEIEVCSIEDYISEIHRLTVRPRLEKKRVVYRGQPDKSFQLIPKLGRVVTQQVFQKNQAIETDLFLKFKTQYPNYEERKIDNDLDLLILAQHYGLATRFLDWTFDPLVALYFACQEDIKGKGSWLKGFSERNPESETVKENPTVKTNADGAVYVRVMSGNKKFTDFPKDFNPFEPHKDHMILPGFHDKRIFVQKGLLELFKDPYNPSQLPVIMKIIIPWRYKRRILRQLEDLQYSKLDLFPTLDNLSESIIKEMI